MGNLLTLKFWFNLRPEPLLPIFEKGFVGFILLLLILAVGSYFFGFKRKGLSALVWRRLYSFALTNFFLSLIIFFFNYEMVPFLSARFWLLFLGVEMLVWLVFIFKYLLRIPEKRKKIEEENNYKKYIP